MSSPQVEARVDLGAVAHNTRILCDHAGDAAVMAVVKADGYGHGAVECAQAALAAGARELGVTTIAEGVQLRNAGIAAPILTWLNTTDADFAAAIRAGLEIAVPSVAHLRAVALAAQHIGRQAMVSVKVDTGLNRNGTSETEYPPLLAELSRLVAGEVVHFRAIFSHLARADEPHHPVVNYQRDRFTAAIAQAKDAGLQPELVHLANSAATLTRPDLAFDLVRPGIAVYGLTPVPDIGDFGLRPAMTFRSRVALVKDVPAGGGVSYGHEWIAPHDTVVALVPAGYNDGVLRALGNRFSVWVNGRRYLNRGRICMDQFMIELGPGNDSVSEGDEVVLFGNGTRGEPTAQEWADLLGTIHYEVAGMPRGRTERTFGYTR